MLLATPPLELREVLLVTSPLVLREMSLATPPLVLREVLLATPPKGGVVEFTVTLYNENPHNVNNEAVIAPGYYYNCLGGRTGTRVFASTSI